MNDLNSSFFPPFKCRELRSGVGKGPIICGNLTMLTTLLGTPWDPNYSGAILVLEDVGDAPFRIHRSLTQLKHAGKLDNLSGLVFGRFSRCEAKHGPSVDDVIDMVVNELLQDFTYPIIRNLEFGHWGENQALAIGVNAQIENNVLKILESPLAT